MSCPTFDQPHEGWAESYLEPSSRWIGHLVPTFLHMDDKFDCLRSAGEKGRKGDGMLQILQCVSASDSCTLSVVAYTVLFLRGTHASGLCGFKVGRADVAAVSVGCSAHHKTVNLVPHLGGNQPGKLETGVPWHLWQYIPTQG